MTVALSALGQIALPASDADLYYRVEEIERAREELSARGVPFDDAPHLIAKIPDCELWMAFFRDPDRNLLALMEEKR